MSEEIDPELLAILVCPLTRTPLRWDAEARELVSEAAGLANQVGNGFRCLLGVERRSVDTTP